jgi:DNA-directed RNA polymerase specialized sigma24 family protein
VNRVCCMGRSWCMRRGQLGGRRTQIAVASWRNATASRRSRGGRPRSVRGAGSARAGRNLSLPRRRRALRLAVPDSPQRGVGAPAPQDAATSEPQGTSVSGGEDAFAAADARAFLTEPLRALPVEYRAAVVLRYVEGASNEEVAAAPGIWLAAAKSRIHRGRMQLREQLEQWEREQEQR